MFSIQGALHVHRTPDGSLDSPTPLGAPFSTICMSIGLLVGSRSSLGFDLKCMSSDSRYLTLEVGGCNMQPLTYVVSCVNHIDGHFAQ